MLAGNAVWLCWNPYAALCANALWNKSSIYLFWGVSNAAGFRNKIATLRLRWILRKAGAICVNDGESAGDVLRLSGRKANIIPYVVDTEFFQAGSCPRNSTIVVPGNNDRDEEFVATLIAQGRSVIRVTSSDRVRRHYRSRGLESVLRYRISFTELRDLYQQCGVVLFPISNPNHAAGQTAALEALACGAPIVITSGRTATIVGNYPGVHVSLPEQLSHVVLAVLSQSNAARSLNQHRVVCQNHSFSTCVESLLNEIRSLSNETPVVNSKSQKAA